MSLIAGIYANFDVRVCAVFGVSRRPAGEVATCDNLDDATAARTAGTEALTDQLAR
jgi:hypothetical protein